MTNEAPETQVLNLISDPVIELPDAAETTSTRPGIRTTEFWLSLAALVLVNLGIVLKPDSPFAQMGAVIGNALVAAGYAMFRGGVKKEQAKIAQVSAANMANVLTANAQVEAQRAASAKMAAEQQGGR